MVSVLITLPEPGHLTCSRNLANASLSGLRELMTTYCRFPSVLRARLLWTDSRWRLSSCGSGVVRDRQESSIVLRFRHQVYLGNNGSPACFAINLADADRLDDARERQDECHNRFAI